MKIQDYQPTEEHLKGVAQADADRAAIIQRLQDRYAAEKEERTKALFEKRKVRKK